MDSTSSGDRTLHFRTGAALIARLGSQQLKDPFTAVIELVKNAYDADATVVTVEIREADGAQAIRVQDDGTGMTLDDLRNKWAYLATENKIREDRSPLYRRRRLGQKGVGRFAAEKLGGHLTLRTRTDGFTHVNKVQFSWDQLQADRELVEYSFPVTHTKPDNSELRSGTRLDIRDLRMRWTHSDAAKLRSQLCSLIDPDATTSEFRIRFVTPWNEQADFLANPLPGNETHKLEFSLSEDGTVTLVLSDEKQSKPERVSIGPQLFGPIRGVLRYYGTGLRRVDTARGGNAEVDWNVGVRIFRDGCRVRPYGEPGAVGDWLQIYRSRYLKGSRFRLKPHYLEGNIYVSKDGNPELRDTTSREGLEENAAFNALVGFIQDQVSALSEAVRDQEVRQERQRIRYRYEKALEPLAGGLSHCSSEAYRRSVTDADRAIRSGLRSPELQAEVRNAHWECLDCKDTWKAPKEKHPSACREYSVGRDGQSTMRLGCGSQNIQRKENVRSSNKPIAEPQSVDEVFAGVPAYVSGVQLRPVIDWEMGENDEEAEVRPHRRELAINGRHPAFRAADLLDGNETAEGTDFEALRAVAGLTIHLIDSAALAWGTWHCGAGGDLSTFVSKFDELKRACLGSLSSRFEGGLG